MSKERLEEIKEKLDFHIDWASNTHYAEISEGELKEYRQFIIEQAEQSEQLRNLANYDNLQTVYNYFQEIQRLEQQNERYREALEQANEELSHDHDDIENCARNAYHTICKALEGDSNG